MGHSYDDSETIHLGLMQPSLPDMQSVRVHTNLLVDVRFRHVLKDYEEQKMNTRLKKLIMRAHWRWTAGGVKGLHIAMRIDIGLDHLVMVLNVELVTR